MVGLEIVVFGSTVEIVTQLCSYVSRYEFLFIAQSWLTALLNIMATSNKDQILACTKTKTQLKQHF